MTDTFQSRISANPNASGHDDWGPEQLVAELRVARDRWRSKHHRAAGRQFPARATLERIITDLKGALFPMRLGPADVTTEGEDHYVAHTLGSALMALREQIEIEFNGALRDRPADHHAHARAVTQDFARGLSNIRSMLDSDVEAAFFGDPAARSVDEVLLCYPGITAVLHHRIAHRLHTLGAVLIARIIAEIAHSQTGIDIHPGAKIGRSFFIDHGTGVVIGETAEIGDRVRLYQAVTLGAKSFPQDGEGLRKGLSRHPIIEDDVVIYAGATVLGRVTIGRGSTIGGNVWLTESVPPGSRINQARTLRDKITTEIDS